MTPETKPNQSNPHAPKTFPRWGWYALALAAVASGAIVWWYYGAEKQPQPQQEASAPAFIKSALYAKAKTDNPNDVIKEGEELLKRYPHDAYIAHITAIAYHAAGMEPPVNRTFLLRAEELYSRYLAAYPQDSKALAAFARIENTLFKHKEGIEVLENALRKSPSIEENPSFALGLLYDHSGNREKAKFYYEENIKKDPAHVSTYIYLSRLAAGEVPPNVALMRAYAEKAIEFTPPGSNRSDGHVFLAEAYHFEGNNQKARELAEKAIVLNSKNPGGYHVLGEALLEEHRPGATIFLDDHLVEAIRALEQSLKLNSSFSHSYYHLGIAYWLNGEQERARQTWLNGLEILPADFVFPEWYKPVIKKDLEDALANPDQFSPDL